MTAISIRKEEEPVGVPRFRAVAGDHESTGRTMGEALDSLTAEMGNNVAEAAVLIQRFEPDAHFTDAQHLRMQALLARRAALTLAERAELEALVDAELDATVARTRSAVRKP